MKRHVWADDFMLGPIKVCTECPEIWWLWRGDAEPSNACSMNWRRFSLKPWEKDVVAGALSSSAAHPGEVA